MRNDLLTKTEIEKELSKDIKQYANELDNHLSKKQKSKNIVFA